MIPRISPSRLELKAHEAATRADPTTLVHDLRGALGPQLVALIAGVSDTRTVHRWADGSRELRGATREQRLRLAYQLWKLIATRDSDGLAQAWFAGLNPELDDTSPAELLRNCDPDEIGPRLLAAARAFAASGA